MVKLSFRNFLHFPVKKKLLKYNYNSKEKFLVLKQLRNYS
jgi:hypothetical protein